MNAEKLVKLIEEMMDLKVQQYAESHLKPNPEVARLLMEKRETDRRRLEQIRAELARLRASQSMAASGGAGEVIKIQAPSSKIQAPENDQAPTANFKSRRHC